MKRKDLVIDNNSYNSIDTDIVFNSIKEYVNEAVEILQSINPFAMIEGMHDINKCIEILKDVKSNIEE